MSVIELQNQLISFLLKKDTFYLSSDINKIKVSKDQEPIKSELIEQGFRILEQKNIVRRIDYTISPGVSGVAWVTDASFESYDQDVTISPIIAEAVANIINQYREAFGIKNNPCNKLQIGQVDIQTLIVICSELLNKVEQDDDEDK